MIHFIRYLTYQSHYANAENVIILQGEQNQIK